MWVFDCWDAAADKTTMSGNKANKGKMNKVENKARATTAGKARTRKAGHEVVSDQKSHEYHWIKLLHGNFVLETSNLKPE